MGVPNFFRWITNKITTSLIDFKKSVKVNNLYFDYNGLIHPVSQYVLKKYVDKIRQMTTQQKDEFIIDNVLKYTDLIIKLLNPDNIYITIDGVVPSAKIQQQRFRRYKSIKEKEVIKHFSEKYGQEYENLWDSNKISPMTEFMNNLADNLRSHYKGNKKIVISDSSECLEGEHKIMKIIKSKPSSETHYIYGLDADLIILSMLLCNPNVYLFREKLYFGRSDLKREFDIEKPEFSIIILNEILNYFMTLVPSELKNRSNYISGIISDFAFLTYFIGNDFLPHQQIIHLKNHGFDILINNYLDYLKKNKQFLTEYKGNQFIGALKMILQSIVEQEKHMLVVQQNIIENFNYKNDDLDKVKYDINEYNFIRDKYDKKISYKVDSYKSDYNLYHFGTKNKNEMNEICYEYMKGFEWVFNYYKYNEPLNWNWYYGYFEAPLLIDLYGYLDNYTWGDLTKFEKYNKIDSIVQLINILPRSSLEIIPKKYHKLYDETSPINDLLPNDYGYDYEGKTYLYECHIKIPKLDLDRVANAVAEC